MNSILFVAEADRAREGKYWKLMAPMCIEMHIAGSTNQHSALSVMQFFYNGGTCTSIWPGIGAIEGIASFHPHFAMTKTGFYWLKRGSLSVPDTTRLLRACCEGDLSSTVKRPFTFLLTSMSAVPLTDSNPAPT